jgi:hypothetical protein
LKPVAALGIVPQSNRLAGMRTRLSENQRLLKCAAAHKNHSWINALLQASSFAEVLSMLEITQETLEKVDPLLDSGDTESAGELLMALDHTSLCALLIHVLQERGAAVADAVAAGYLRAAAAQVQHRDAA